MLRPAKGYFGHGRRWSLVTTFVVALAAIPREALAAESVAKLSDRLNHSDFRVRTQAALALGASSDKEAIEPLCSALGDDNTTVRAAAAAALGKLALGGGECLRKRLKEEANTSVKSVIEKAMAHVERGGGGGASPVMKVSASTKYYIAIASTIDKTGRKKSDVHEIVRGAMTEGAGSADGYALAPDKETAGEAQKVLSKFKKLKAFYLWPKVSPPEYTGGKLTIKFEISVFTYPGKSLKGTIPLKLTMPDVERGDVESENELIRMAASKAFEKFTQNVGRME